MAVMELFPELCIFPQRFPILMCVVVLGQGEVGLYFGSISKTGPTNLAAFSRHVQERGMELVLFV